MTIPDYQTFMRPLLAYGSDGAEKNMQEAIAALSDQFSLTPEEREITVTSGKEKLVANRIHWARTYLDKAGALTRTRRSHFQVTERGMDLLKKYPEKIETKTLRQFPEFIAFQTPKSETQPTPTAEPPPEQIAQSKTPDERIVDAYSEIQSRLEAELLDRIGEKPPAFFEALVVDLIVKMGYGGSHENVVQRIGKSGDQGIDGIVNEDPLGLDVVYIQAKRYAPDATIGREVIQSFAGALDGKKATKGIFFATCAFTKSAKDYADSVHKKIILIDGHQLVWLLTQYDVGVRVEREIQIKRIDLDYFDQEDS